MNLLKCLLINNDCYKSGAKLKPKGVMVHSTGANNPKLRRYVQPVKGQENYSGLIAALGKNTAGNSWNRSGVEKCVHAFIGKLADGSIATVQTLPWEMQAWHCYYGPKGSGNTTHISFEICEDNLDDPVYFRAVYKEAVEFTAYLCGLYNLDPLADGVVICHKEGARRGIASNHSDVENWFPRMGYNMDGFRQDVKDRLEDEDMTGEEIYRKLTDYLLSQKPPAWVEQQGEYAEAVREGITDGSDPTRLTTRYESAIMNLRVLKKARSE